MNNHVITHYFQRNRNKPEFALIKHGDRMIVRGMTGFYAVGSVAGCALDDNDDPLERALHAKANHHKLVWVNALPSIIDCSGKSGEQKAMENAPHGAKMHCFQFGELVWMEGHAYRLDKAPNNNVGLTPVTVYFDGRVTD